MGESVSENGPREGTRDLPRRSPEAGYRALEEDSAAGAAYRSVSQAFRRRRAELVALAAAGGTPASIVADYHVAHPLEPRVSAREVAVAIHEARGGTLPKPR